MLQAGERLEGISGSMGNSSSSIFGWFGGDEDSDVEEEKVQDKVGTAQPKDNKVLADSDTTQLAGNGCVKEKVYTLDVENADEYERIEDFPFTYECVNRR